MSLQENDFIGGLTGTTSVDGSSIVVPVNLAPFLLEGNKTFKVRLRRDNPSGQTISLSPEFTIVDYTSLDSVTANVTTIDEGQAVEITLLTSNVPDGSTVYYTIDGFSGDLDDNDIVPFSGNVVINDNTGTILLTANADLSGYLDDDESFTVQIRTESTSGALVGNSQVISIVDTSNSVRLASLTLNRDSALSTGSIYESESFVIELTGINGEGLNSGNLYYTIQGNANIIGATSGRIGFNDNFGNSNVLIFETSVPTDTIAVSNIRIHTNSINGAILGSSALSILNYVSGVVFPKVSTVSQVYPNVSSVLGAQSIGFNVDLTNSYEGETLQYKTTGNANLQTGSFVVSSNTSTIIITADDDTIEKNIGVDIYRSTDYNGVLNTSNSLVDIIPKDEVLIDVIPPSKDNIVEGEGFEFLLLTRYGVPGSLTLYWDATSTGNLIAASGQANGLSNIIVVPETTVTANTTDEVFVRIRETSPSGPIVFSSNLFTVVNYEGQANLDFVTPVVTDITSNSEVSFGSIVFTITTAGGNTLGNLYYTTNVYDGSNITFTSSNGYVDVSSDSGTIELSSTGTGYFSLHVSRAPGTPILFESNTITCGFAGIGGNAFILSGTTVSHVFTGPGTFNISQPLSNATILVVGGGGGGASSVPRVVLPEWGSWAIGGGGGGGGVVKYVGAVSSGSYPISIGQGGAQGTTPTTSAAGEGTDSTGFGLTAKGGGRGGSSGSPQPAKTSTPGGSGGGGQAAIYPTYSPSITSQNAPNSVATQPSQPGNSGIFGGGGAGNGGSAGNFGRPSSGGSAPAEIGSLQIPISYGSPSPLGPSYRRFGVGGNGGPYGANDVGANALVNTGGGGGGGGYLNFEIYGPGGQIRNGGAGAPGIVIVQYNISENI